jgi:myo-inositol-1(or 4)-monophosphatase
VTAPTLATLDLAALLAGAVDIARQAGALVAEGHRHARVEMTKDSEFNVVTDTDHASEALIVRALAERFPSHGVVVEEGSASTGDGITWVVDPLDGTNNFAHGYPMFAVNLAAVLGDTILVGVTYDPLRDELFTAQRGAGAALNGQPLHVSPRARLGESLVATGFPYDKATNPDNNLPQFVSVVPHVRGVRRSGSAALDLAYVAAGRLDAYWERGTNAWDVAPGILMVQEAGGLVTDYDGSPPHVDGGRFVASNGRIHAALMAQLRADRPLPRA